MSGTRPKPAAARLAEEHLGDRLSALVDGELGHDARERVLAHLATCCRCRAEADAQRRLKSAFAEAAPPPPSESFLARLQGLPGGGDHDAGPPAGSPFGPGPDAGVFGVPRDRFAFGYVPAGSGHAAPQGHGFPVHPVGRPDDGRSASRGLRFAVAAAGAVSLAAVALGGVSGALPGDLAADARGGPGAGSTVAPSRVPGTGTGTGTGSGAAPSAPEAQRRRSAVPLLAQGAGTRPRTPAAPVTASAPLLPGVPTPLDGTVRDTVRELSLPEASSGAGTATPLIRPLDEITPFTGHAAWPTAAWNALPGPSAAPAPGTSATASAPSLRQKP